MQSERPANLDIASTFWQSSSEQGRAQGWRSRSCR